MLLSQKITLARFACLCLLLQMLYVITISHATLHSLGYNYKTQDVNTLTKLFKNHIVQKYLYEHYSKSPHGFILAI